MKRLAILALVACTALNMPAQTPEVWKKLKGNVNLFMGNDLGRNGYYDQKPIAEVMGEMATVIGPECVIAAGDVHHFYGIQSVSDPLWTTNFELVYSHPSLMIPWKPVLGNHEYRGNTQAVLDYAGVSRRWMMPARYYTEVYEDDGTRIRVVYVDTTPLIERYRHNPAKYHDAGEQDIDAQLSWLDATLTAATEEWIIVVGHHPIYAYTDKAESERTDMQQRLGSVIRRHDNVDVYACGHVHNFQHIRRGNDGIDYVVNSAGSLAREVGSTEGAVFCSGEPGFSVITADQTKLVWNMVDKTGTVIYSFTRLAGK